MSEFWNGCLICENKCCNLDVAHPLFVTQEEMECIKALCSNDEFDSFNKSFPCFFLAEDGLCKIHGSKPIDCRLFPFDVMHVDGKFLWIVRELDCLILQEVERFEEYLQYFEENFIPVFGQHLANYAEFRSDELASKYGVRVLREVQFNK